ncbi:MAG: glycosyltransferase [Candidatus Omnitrophota bacterium]
MTETAERPLRVSVVIPVRNGEATIMACLNSLACQDQRPDEVVVVENGSEDNTVSLVKEWMLTQPGLHPSLVVESACGPSAARNRGVEAAKGDVIAFLDADCIAPPDWLRNISSEMSQGVGAVGGPYEGISLPSIEKYASMSWFLESHPSTYALSSPFVSRFLLGGNMALFRKDFANIGGFDETLHVGEDLDLSFRLKKAGTVLKYLPDLAVTHKTHSSFSKRVSRALSHGMLQARIAKRDFPHLLLVSAFKKSWCISFPATVALELSSLTKILCGLTLIAWMRPAWGLLLFFILVVLWGFRMTFGLLRLRVPVTFADVVALPLGWGVARLATETGRLIGSVRHNVFCW